MRLIKATRVYATYLAVGAFVASSVFATQIPAKATPSDRILTIHYHRTAGDYANWNLWAWGPTSPDDGGASIPFNKIAGSLAIDCGGVSVSVTISDPTITEFGGGIFRKSITGNDWASIDGADDPYLPPIPIAPAGNTDVYFAQGIDAEHGPTIINGVPGRLRTVSVHYKRKIGDYAGWNIAYSGINDTDHTAFGATKDLTGSVVTPPIVISNCELSSFRFIVRRSVVGNNWAVVDGPSSPSGAAALTYALNPTGDTDIWVKQGATASTKPTTSATYIKDAQTIGTISTSVKVGKTLALPAKSDATVVINWTSSTTKICNVVGGKLKGIKAGPCKLKGVAPANATVIALTVNKVITVKN